MSAFSKRRPMHAPSSVQSHHHVGVLAFLEAHRRILGNAFGRIPEPISIDAFSAAGYCLDAHDTMPAGSTERDEFGPGRDDWVAVQTIIERGAA